MTGPVAAIVLAAGRGTRFGPAPKLLAELAGTPLVRRAAEAALSAGLTPVLVVVGHGAEAVAKALRGLPVTIVPNPAFAHGLSTSLKAGFSALPAAAPGAVILLGDMPQVSPTLVDTLVRAWRERGEPVALVPTYRGRRGNPVLLSARLAPAIAALTGDNGAGPLLRELPDVDFPVEDEAVTIDIDTPAALRALAGKVEG